MRRVPGFVLGTVLAAIGVACMLRAELGAGPADVFVGAITERLDSTHGTVASAFLLLLVAVAAGFGHRPGLGTAATVVGFGPVLDRFLAVVPVPSAPLLAVAMLAAGVSLVGIGVAFVLDARLGAGPVELCVRALATTAVRPEPRVRTVFELTLVAAGIALGGPFGAGTLAIALAIGPAIGVGGRLVAGLRRASATGVIAPA